MQLFREILKRIVFLKDSAGKVIVRKPTASSLALPVIDEKATRQQMDELVREILDSHDAEVAHRQLRTAVCEIKERYLETHDGFAQAKGVRKQDQITVADMYAFSVGACYCFEALPRTAASNAAKVALGVMTPARQDCGKNLIRLVWQGCGYEVIDLGANLQPQTWLKAASQNHLAAVAVSCMKNKCVNGLRALLQELKASTPHVPVVIGGIAVNKTTAYELTQESGIAVHYGHDVSEAEAVLSKALAGAPVAVPIVKEVVRVPLPGELSNLAKNHAMELYVINLADIVIDANARQGCNSCEGDRRRLCPLETGFERQKSIQESREFLGQFQQAVIVIAKQPVEDDRQTSKSLWNVLITIEGYFGRLYNDAQAYRFPMPCPMCKPKDCKLAKGGCALRAYYRPVHERDNINMKATLTNVFADNQPLGIYAVILIR